jgi:hypothetical protein
MRHIITLYLVYLSFVKPLQKKHKKLFAGRSTLIAQDIFFVKLMGAIAPGRCSAVGLIYLGIGG